MIDEKSLDEARAWIGRSQSLEGVVTPFAASCMAVSYTHLTLPTTPYV